MRLLMSLLVIMMFVPGVASAQYNDDSDSLLDEATDVGDPDGDQVDIQLGDDSGLKDAETEAVTEQTLCCQMPESERAADELCTGVVCP